MVLECQLKPAEMREVFRMNLSKGFWVRIVVINIRLLLLLAVVGAAVIAKIAHQDGRDWQGIVSSLAVALLLIGFYVWRLLNTVKQSAAKVNAACDRMTLDPQGITSANAAGATSFTPWTQYKRWKEGKLVFTIGDSKNFRTVPKSALTESQAGELRGLLQGSIR